MEAVREGSGRERSGYLLVLAAIVLFSTIEVASKHLQSGAQQAGADQVAALRFFLGSLFLFPFLLLPGKGGTFNRAVRERPWATAALGLVGVFLTFFLFHRAVERSDASTAAVVFSMNPVFTAVVAFFVLRERLGCSGWLGVAVGCLGAFAAITRFDFGSILGRGDLQGGLIMLLSALSWSFYTVYGKKFSEEYGSLTVSFLSMAWGSAAFAVLLFAEGGWSEMAGYSASSWLWILYLGVVTVGVGYLLYFEGMKRVPASRGASLFYLKPVLALVFARVALGESISPTLVFAALLVAAGILLVTRSRGGPVAGVS